MVIFRILKKNSIELVIKAGSILFILIGTNLIFSQSNALITILQAGNCNNVNFADEFIDSICKKNKVLHLYYLKGIKENEMEKYAQKIFNRSFNLKSLVNKEQINNWQLNKINSGNVVLIIKENKITDIIDIHEFEEQDLLKLKFIGENQILSNGKFNSKLVDSFQLKYNAKVEVDPIVRLNKQSVIVKQDSFLYVLEPLFNEMLYKINCKTGKVINKLYLRNLIPYDSILHYHFGAVKNGFNIDTIQKWADSAGRNPDKRFFNLFISNNQLIVSGDYQMLTFIERYKVINLSHNIVYKFDLNLLFINYYFDRYLNYSGYYPNQQLNDNNSTSDKIQYQVLQNFNEQLAKKRIIYFNLTDENHQLNKYDKDTLDIPKNFKGKFYSNITCNFVNMNSKENPVWLFDPYPYLYYPKDSFYHDLIADTLTKEIKYLKENTGFHQNWCVSKTYKFKPDEIIIIMLFYSKMYRINYDIINRKIIGKIQMDDLNKYNMQLLIDNNNKAFYCPIDSEDSGNYIYFE